MSFALRAETPFMGGGGWWWSYETSMESNEEARCLGKSGGEYSLSENGVSSLHHQDPPCTYPLWWSLESLFSVKTCSRRAVNREQVLSCIHLLYAGVYGKLFQYVRSSAKELDTIYDFRF